MKGERGETTVLVTTLKLFRNKHAIYKTTKFRRFYAW